MKKLVIFDMDGTILDTLEDLKNSLNFALTANGMPERTIDEVRRFVGNGIGKLIERGVPNDATPEQIAGVQAAFYPHYTLHCNDHTRPYEGIPQIIATLRRAGYLTAVVSNKADFAVQELCRLWFDGLFDVAVGERDGLQRKPAPDSVFEVCRSLNVAVEDAVYIGDSEVDYQTACNAGMDVISVEWGFRDAAFLRSIGAKTIVSSPRELAACFQLTL